MSLRYTVHAEYKYSADGRHRWWKCRFFRRKNLSLKRLYLVKSIDLNSAPPRTNDKYQRA